MAGYLSGEIGTEISIEKVDIIFFDRLELKGIYVEDTKHDTLLYTESIFAEIDDWSIDESFVDVGKVELNQGVVHIRKYEGDSTLNFQHLVDYFASEEPDTSKSEFGVNVRNVWLEDINFVYHDENAEPLENGMDYAHIDLRHMTARFSEFAMKGDSLLVNIDQLQFKDRSGLTLSKFGAKVLYCPEVIALQELKIALNNSWLYADVFELQTPNGAEDFGDFVNKVRFNTQLRNSQISLRDVAYFVPAIWGMTDRLKIENAELSGPVYGMKIKDFHLTMLEDTEVKGDFVLPAFDDLENFLLDERLDLLTTSIKDVEALNLSPFLEDGETHISVPADFRAAKKVKVENATMIGFISSFVVDADVYSGIGDIHSETGLKFFTGTQEHCRNNSIPYEGEDSLYYYSGKEGGASIKDVVVENLNLGAATGNDLLGLASGYVRILPGSKGFDMKTIDLDFTGHFDHLDLSDYPYHSINIRNGNFSNDRFTGKIDIEDDHLALNYDGFIDLKRDLTFDFTVQIDHAHLAELTNTHEDSIFHSLSGLVHVVLKGNSVNSLRGQVTGTNMSYQDAKRNFFMQNLSVDLKRVPGEKGQISNDTIYIRSDYADLDLFGVFDLEEMHQVILNELSYVAGNMVGDTSEHASKNEFFDLEIRLKNINPVIDFFTDEIYIAPDSRIVSQYDKQKKIFGFDFNSALIQVGDIKLTDFKTENRFDKARATVYYQAETAEINDSTKVRNFYVDSELKNNHAMNSVGWDRFGNIKPALFAFESDFTESGGVNTQFDPSFFFLQDNKYKISTRSAINWDPDKIEVEDFKIYAGDHFLKLDGIVSKNPEDWLKFEVHDFDLTDLNGFLESSDISLEGVLNIDGQVADVYDKIRFSSKSEVSELYVNENLVGDLEVTNEWQNNAKAIAMMGSLKREDLPTFQFAGNYFVEREKENLDVNLNFDRTDISFLNAFKDPELYTNIEGNLNGRLKLSGELNNPVIKGDLDIQGLLVFVPMFNVGYGIDGTVTFDKGAIYADYLDVYDQEGNKALAGLSIFHYDYANWNYDISLDMTETRNRFFVLDTKYKEGEFYYGKAYIDGFVNISGFGGKTRIEVDAETMKGTELTLPMYGASELEEGTFIVWTGDTLKTADDEDQVEGSGLELVMNFKITPECLTTVVFDPITEDQLSAKGKGDLAITVDEYYEVTMFGKFEITEGQYDMRMKNVVNKSFTIKPGSSLIWTQSPYDALIDIVAQFERANVDFSPIMSEMSSDNNSATVVGSLIMRETLMAPKLSFDLAAPQASQLAKSALDAVRANRDVLNKQFFSVLMQGSFFTDLAHGAGGAGLEVARNAAESQINAILGNVSESYDLSLNLEDGQTDLEVGTQLGEKLTVRTSFGVVSGTDEGETGNLVGDVSVDYRLDDDPADDVVFNVNFFNESNTGADATQGPYTQGIGLHYEETFNTAREFRLLQQFLNIFRRSSKDVKIEKRKKSKYVPLPPENVDE